MNISQHRRHHHLPEEVIEEILVRLPFKSVFRFQCVCKSWFNLIKNSPSICNHLKEYSDVQSFIPLCFIHKSKQFKDSWFLNLFLFHDDDVYSSEEEEEDMNNCLTRFRKGIRRWLDALCDSRKLDAKYPLPVLTFKLPSSNRPSLKYKSGLKLVRHCNGIMCLSHPDFILLVNPLLHEVKTLSNPIHPPRLVGFGFDNITTMDFKVVRLFNNLYIPKAEVYNLKTNVWRKTPFPFTFLGCINRSTFLNGVIHWCVEGSVDGTVFRWKILTFNIVTELFELMDLPIDWHHAWKNRIGLFVLNQDSLAFVDYASSSSIPSVGVWTMNKHEEATGTTTWTKLYSIESLPEPLRKPISFWNKDKLLYETNSGRLVLYDLLTRRMSLVFDPLQVSPHNMGYYSEICLEVKAGVLCGSSLVSMNM